MSGSGTPLFEPSAMLKQFVDEMVSKTRIDKVNIKYIIHSDNIIHEDMKN